MDHEDENERMQDHFWTMLGDYDPKGRYLSSEIVDQKIFDVGDPHLLKENSGFS